MPSPTSRSRRPRLWRKHFFALLSRLTTYVRFPTEKSVVALGPSFVKTAWRGGGVTVAPRSLAQRCLIRVVRSSCSGPCVLPSSERSCQNASIHPAADGQRGCLWSGATGSPTATRTLRPQRIQAQASQGCTHGTEPGNLGAVGPFYRVVRLSHNGDDRWFGKQKSPYFLTRGFQVGFREHMSTATLFGKAVFSNT